MTSHELYTITEKSGNSNQKRDSFCRYRGTDYVQQKKHTDKPTIVGITLELQV